MVLSRSQLEATMVRMGATTDHAKRTIDNSIKNGRYSLEGDRLTFRSRGRAARLLKLAEKKDGKAQRN